MPVKLILNHLLVEAILLAHKSVDHLLLSFIFLLSAHSLLRLLNALGWGPLSTAWLYHFLFLQCRLVFLLKLLVLRTVKPLRRGTSFWELGKRQRRAAETALVKGDMLQDVGLNRIADGCPRWIGRTGHKAVCCSLSRVHQRNIETVSLAFVRRRL